MTDFLRPRFFFLNNGALFYVLTRDLIEMQTSSKWRCGKTAEPSKSRMDIFNILFLLSPQKAFSILLDLIISRLGLVLSNLSGLLSSIISPCFFIKNWLVLAFSYHWWGTTFRLKLWLLLPGAAIKELSKVSMSFFFMYTSFWSTIWGGAFSWVISGMCAGTTPGANSFDGIESSRVCGGCWC